MDWQIECFGEAESTNSVARERVLAAWGRGGAAEGIVVTAGRQSAGRGQHGRRWESPAGGLYMSAVVERLPVEMRGRLALIAGAAVADALVEPCTFFGEEEAELGMASAGAQIRLRWPNDLVIPGNSGEDRKVGGILCEAVAMGEHWAGIIGIGVNVVTAEQDFPASLRGRVTSLIAEDGRLRTVTGVLDAVLQHLSRAVLGCHETGGWGRLLERVRALDGLRGRRVVVERRGGHAEGSAGGIDEAGELLVETSQGKVAIAMGTIVSVDGNTLRP